MEHWGLITFREVNLLFDEKEASGANKQRVNLVVSHEVSHQWFGNLVTMDWWDDLWLNEGFATFMEYIGANEKENDWGMTDQFVTDEVQTVMVLDAGESSHPIINNVENPDQINEVFDAISYSKGASVIKMLETTLGRDSFFNGVSQYLRNFSYMNAKTDDLWAKLGTVGNTSVKAMMDTWTRQMGFPYINVTIISLNEVQLDQKRFGVNSSMSIHQSNAPFGSVLEELKVELRISYLRNSFTQFDKPTSSVNATMKEKETLYFRAQHENKDQFESGNGIVLLSSSPVSHDYFMEA
ncbi:hypothetical protein CHS0354_031966 [Potamilus streckersoni]|uniref:glutamyl aminopeptidase n=1 Tax=Potamilus streckersoni TaxID=2493646 RepID=A0AAE0WEJ5_9BIVA|nr:hypothetical protein CHS0354_031966 [Potamilus streckersoni]